MFFWLFQFQEISEPIEGKIFLKEWPKKDFGLTLSMRCASNMGHPHFLKISKIARDKKSKSFNYAEVSKIIFVKVPHGKG